MKEIKRWNVVANLNRYPFTRMGNPDDAGPMYVKSNIGKVVFYEDHEAIVKELQAKIESLELQLKELQFEWTVSPMDTLVKEGVTDSIGIAVCKEEDCTPLNHPLNNLIKCLTIIRDKAGDHKIIIENHLNAYLGIAVFCPEENFKREDFETLRELNCVSVYHEHREYYGSMHYYFTLYPTDSQ